MKNFIYFCSSSYRWWMLLFFSLVVVIIQVLWLNFAPVISLVSHKYAISDSIAGLLILTFPVCYILFSYPAGFMIDKYGYRQVSLTAALLIALFSLARCYDQYFIMVLIGQTGIAIAQPFVMNALSSLVVDHFEPKQHALATGLITAGIFIGMAIGLGATPALIDKTGLHVSMVLFAVCAVIISIIYALMAKTGQRLVVPVNSSGKPSDIFCFFKQKQLMVIFILAFLAMGYFNGLISWLEPMMASKKITAEQVGLAGAILMLGGIVGSLIFSVLSDRICKRRPFVILSAALGLIITWPLYLSINASYLYIQSALLGFFFLPGYPLLLTMAEEKSKPEEIGRVTSIFMLLGNLGGAVVITMMPILNWNHSNWNNATFGLTVLLVVALFFAFKLKECMQVC